MSRLRIVKGKIFEKIGGDLQYYSEADITETASEIYAEQSKTRILHAGNPDKPTAGEIKAKCLVQFRPHNNWTGNFGFDWVRLGDTGLLGDKFYKNIVGKNRDASGKINNDVNYGNNIVADENEYQKLLRKFTVLKVNYNKDFYIVPWLSLYKGKNREFKFKN